MMGCEPLDASKVDGKEMAKMVKDVADRDYADSMCGPMLVAYLHPKEDGTPKLTCNLPIKKKRLPEGIVWPREIAGKPTKTGEQETMKREQIESWLKDHEISKSTTLTYEGLLEVLEWFQDDVKSESHNSHNLHFHPSQHSTDSSGCRVR